MRLMSLSAVAVLPVFIFSGCATSSQQKQLTSQVQLLQKDIENLRKDIDTFQKISSASSYITFGANTVTPDRIAKIEFPRDPSTDNLKNYINEIIVASRGQRSYSPMDPQVTMLARVGADNLPLLIEALPEGLNSSGGYHLESAIKVLAEGRHKDLILKELPIRPRLVSVVIEKGWEEDAKEILVRELKGSEGNRLPIEWFRAVASFQDPSTYDALTNYFAKSMSASYLYQYIQRLPGIQLDGPVAAAWALTKSTNSNSNSYFTGSMAVVAIGYGHQDAAEALIDLLKNPPARLSSSVNPRLALLMHLDTTGSNEEIIAWYEANKENLVFDRERKKFKLKK